MSWESTVGFGQIVGLLHDHLGGAAGIRQHLLEGPQEIAAEVVVLVEDPDLAFGFTLTTCLRGFALRSDTAAGRPWSICLFFRIVPF